jgi:hypothetical protein
MKIVTMATAALLLGMMPLMADEVSPDVDAQIEQIIQAPSQERHRLMNRFKKQLAEMNEEERAAAISKLQERTMTQEQARDRIQTQERLQDASGEPLRTQTRTRDQQMQQLHQTDQMQQTQQMNRMQQMNQVQGAMKPSEAGTQQRGR